MTTTFIRTALICALSPCLGFAQNLKLDFKKVDSLFMDWQKPESPGGVVAILKGEEVIYKNAFGLADIKNGLPNSFGLKYDLGSIAKQFTATCIALLEEQGKLSIEDELGKFYPDFQMAKGIKIKNLLDHTSGIREAYVLATLSGKVNLKGEVRKKFNTKENLINVLKREKDLNFNTGEELAYTNINYILLADIVEKISRKPFYQFADSSIFKPLHMNETVFRYKRKMKIPGETNGYLLKKNKFKKQKAYGGVLGDGKLVSTLNDVVKWEINLRHNVLGKGNPNLADQLYTSSHLNNGELTHYGYGFWITQYRGLKQINHGGDDGRFTSFILKFPKQDLVIIVLANSSRYNNTEQKAYKIADVVLKEFFTKPVSVLQTPKSIALSNDDHKKMKGLYKRIDERGLAKIRKISSANDSLYITSWYFGQGLNLKKVSESNFFAKNSSGTLLYFKFKHDSSGNYFEEQFENNNPLRFEALPSLKPNSEEYLGKYLNESTGARIKISRSKRGIVAHKGIIRIPLIAFGYDQFYAIQNDALLIFQRSHSGEISRLKINAADFRNFLLVKKK